MRRLRFRSHPQPHPPLSQAELNRLRNIERILNPPKPTLKTRFWRLVWGAEEWWCRHVSQRELYRLFDQARALIRKHLDEGEARDPEEHLERLRREIARLQALGAQPFADHEQADIRNMGRGDT